MDQHTPEFLKRLEEKAIRMRDNALKRKPEPMSPFGAEYVGFQNRMWAATIDSMVLLVTVIPLSFILTNILVGYVDTSMMPLLMDLDGVTDVSELKRIIAEFFMQPDRVRFMAVNTLWHLIFLFGYCMWFWKRYGATPGKMLMRQKVVMADSGVYPDYAQGFLRCVGYIVSSACIFLGAIWINFDRKRQAWHDKLAGTVVISTRYRDTQATSDENIACNG